MKNYFLDVLIKFTHEEICTELEQIKSDLMYLDDEVALTRKQRSAFNDIIFRIEKLLVSGKKE